MFERVLNATLQLYLFHAFREYTYVKHILNVNNNKKIYTILYKILIIYMQLFWSLQKQLSRGVFRNRFLNRFFVFYDF